MGSQGFLEGTYWLLEVPNRVPASAVTLGLPRPLERMADSKRMIWIRLAMMIHNIIFGRALDMIGLVRVV